MTNSKLQWSAMQQVITIHPMKTENYPYVLDWHCVRLSSAFFTSLVASAVMSRRRARERIGLKSKSASHSTKCVLEPTDFDNNGTLKNGSACFHNQHKEVDKRPVEELCSDRSDQMKNRYRLRESPLDYESTKKLIGKRHPHNPRRALPPFPILDTRRRASAAYADLYLIKQSVLLTRGVLRLVICGGKTSNVRQANGCALSLNSRHKLLMEGHAPLM